jgi:hypothetical protein
LTIGIDDSGQSPIVIASIVNPAMPQSPIEWRNPPIAGSSINRQSSIINHQSSMDAEAIAVNGRRSDSRQWTPKR